MCVNFCQPKTLIIVTQVVKRQFSGQNVFETKKGIEKRKKDTELDEIKTKQKIGNQTFLCLEKI